MSIAKTENENTVDKFKSQFEAEDPKDVDYRMYSLLSYFIVLILMGLPVWWFTTRVYRASLPITEMYRDELYNKSSKEFGLPLSLEYDILISLVHPDPSGLYVDLNGEDLDINLQPFLEKFSSFAAFVVKSQWLYLTELGAVPQKLGDHYALQESQLPHIITPLETKLWSHLSPRPTINLIIYFPHCSTPLYIYTDKNKQVKTNAFLSPRWGGVHIVNAHRSACESKTFKPDLQQIIATFVAQLQTLFKVTGFKDEDFNELKWKKAEDMLDSTRRTLKSLAQLLSEIPSIVISDEVGEKTNFAVKNENLATEFLSKGDVDNGLKFAKVAFWNSETAFSHPSLLALLYFPDDQKYAVYIPLFLPIMIPVLMSVKVLWKWQISRRDKQKKE